MQRKIDQELSQWKDSPMRMPLIVRGARQVGKSHSIERFGEREFEKTVSVNFELNPSLSECFQSLKPRDIIKGLEYHFQAEIRAGRTLLFLDEIQLCPQALSSLRYFKEQMPELHVIAAGSLLEFILDEEAFSFPVGRAQFLQMKPMSFLEFLQATGKKQLIELIHSISFQEKLPEHLHQLLLDRVREYFLVGGMPQAVEAFVRQDSYIASLYQQQAILDLYKLDFAKYAEKTQHHHLQRLFERAPELVSKHFRFSKIDPEASNPARDYKLALRKLGQAHLLHLVYATAANALPLRSEKNEKKFKLLFLDLGLLQCALEVDASLLQNEGLIQSNKGSLAEQFVGQELLAYQDCYLNRSLFFWERSKAQSSAEIDYVLNLNGTIVPIEVKAGVTGRLKSLKHFLDNKNVDTGVRISELPLAREGQILSVPFYLIHRISDFL